MTSATGQEHMKLKSMKWLSLVICLFCTRIDAQPVIITPLRAFTNNPDGATPMGLVAGQTDGALYGVTLTGGSSDAGSIYKINRDGSNYHLLRSFLLSETDDSASSLPFIGFSVLQGTDGALYGTTKFGGTNGDGTVFKLSNDGNFFTVLHSFGASDANPLNLIQGKDGVLYGGGNSTVFALNTDGSDYRVLHTLISGSEGNGINGKLIQGNDGALYGAATGGGTKGFGTVFKLDTNGANFSVLHTFFATNPDGKQPVAGLMQGSDGALYGTTSIGGTNSGLVSGTIFKLDTDGGNYQTLHNFGGVNDGGQPYGGLVQGLGGVIYGTTENARTGLALGTAFKIGTDGSGYNVLYRFSPVANGLYPYAGLVSGASSEDAGVLYGTCSTSGGSGGGGSGTVFAMLVNPPVMITPITNQTGSNQPVIFWPQWAFNYTLQMTTNLSSTNWVNVSNTVPVTGVQVTNGPPGAYYRLIYQ